MIPPLMFLDIVPECPVPMVLANALVQLGCVGHQTSKSKVNGPRVYFPYIKYETLAPKHSKVLIFCAIPTCPANE